MKFYVHKLGCPKNDCDADYISARLIDDGHEPVTDPEKAESIIVNTCGFILPAKEESIAEILKLGQLKKSGNLQTLVATGCLSQRYGAELSTEIPELDGIFGLGELDQIASALDPKSKASKVIRTEAERLDYIATEKRYISDSLPYAYLKISDGCDRTCTFCAIPGIRGSYRSRPLDNVIREAKFLVESGKKELILVSQETTLYGYDLKQGATLLRLLKELDKIDELKWVRLLYLYPTQISEDLIEYMVEPTTKTLDYFDIPLQHISDQVLKGMDRHMTAVQIQSKIDLIRKHGGRTIRTAFIVGFPGESQAQFDQLCEFVENVRFDRLGVFTYSSEEQTKAANLPDPVPEEIMAERLDELMMTQSAIVHEKNSSLIGKELTVIIDSVSPLDSSSETEVIGRTEADAPDIDQEVIVSGENITVGDLLKVRIDRFEGYDLYGTVVEN